MKAKVRTVPVVIEDASRDEVVRTARIGLTTMRKARELLVERAKKLAEEMGPRGIREQSRFSVALFDVAIALFAQGIESAGALDGFPDIENGAAWKAYKRGARKVLSGARFTARERSWLLEGKDDDDARKAERNKLGLVRKKEAAKGRSVEESELAESRGASKKVGESRASGAKAPVKKTRKASSS